MRKSSHGTCRICHRDITKSGMSRHLKNCLSRMGHGTHSLVIIEGRYNKAYWIYILVPQSSELWEIDVMLRDLWLECCGHLSAFSTQSVSYVPEPDTMTWGVPEKGMDITLRRAVKGSPVLRYEYDFGSTTELTLRVLEEHLSGPDDAMWVVSRNEPPEVGCAECGQTATQLLFDQWEPTAYCDACASPWQEDGETYLLPLINSPRMGVCAYSGPSREP